MIAGLAARGEKVAAFKPAVSGLDEPTGQWPPDHELLAAATGRQAPGEVSPNLFGPAVSPHLAAGDSGPITLEALLAAYEAATSSASAVICEGVGGLLVPLCADPELSVLGFAKAVALPVVVVAHPGLGTISDTRLTVDRLIAEGLEVTAVVLTPWPDAPDAVELSNLETLRALLGIEVVTLATTTAGELAEAARSLPLDRWLPPGE
jgi:dethiobiotin synthetase